MVKDLHGALEDFNQAGGWTSLNEYSEIEFDKNKPFLSGKIRKFKFVAEIY